MADVVVPDLRVLDIYTAHSMQGASRFARENFYLPNAAWIGAYNLAGRTLEELRDPARYLYDLSFVGNLDAVKYPEFSRRVEFFHALEQRLAPLGSAPVFARGSGMPVAEQVEIIQRSRINITFGAPVTMVPRKAGVCLSVAMVCRPAAGSCSAILANTPPMILFPARNGIRSTALMIVSTR